MKKHAERFEPRLPTGQHSIVQGEVADFLMDQFIHAIREDDRPEQAAHKHQVADSLETLRSVVWPTSFGMRTYGPGDDTARDTVFASVLAGLKGASPEETLTLQRTLLDGYGKLGHLYELAGLVARDNFFSMLHKQDIPVDRDAEDYVRQFQQHFISRDEMIEQLNTPAFEMVLTAHPTNVNSLALVASLRRIGEAIETANAEGNGPEALRSMFAGFVQSPLIPLNEQGNVKGLSVRDETLFILHSLGNLYEDINKVYANYDRALENAEPGVYDPLKLDLKFVATSWGSSGDKDGNDNITAETTLEAIAMHRAAILGAYLNDMDVLNLPALDSWKTAMESANAGLFTLMDEMKQKRDDNGFLSPDDFKLYSDRLTTLVIDTTEFLKVLDSEYEHNPTPGLLNLHRHVRMFGAGYGKIEYRETAERYTQILEALIPDYKTWDDTTRAQMLTQLLEHPEQVKAETRDSIAANLKQLMQDGAGKHYSLSDPSPITYQTLKRLQLAGQHSDMIQDNVLAECQSTAHMLEAVYLQKLADNGPLLGIIPLFEDAERMDAVGDIMAGAYENEAYRHHLDRIQERDQRAKPVQQVQFAHSDNARRSGMPAARAYIYDGHRLHEEAGTSHGVETQCFEGGSQIDAYRGGVRAATATMNMYRHFEGAYPIYKATYQGADPFNYSKVPGSEVRHIERGISHMASNCNGFLGGGRNRRILEAQEGEVILHEGQSNADRIALEALKSTRVDYDSQFFGQPVLDIVLSLLNDNGAGNIGSRKVSRAKKPDEASPVVFASVSSVEQGATLKAEQVRTITYSEIFQHSGITPTWLGGGRLKEKVHTAYNDRMRELGKPEIDELTPSDLHALFESSSVFRDAVDRMAYGMACVNFPHFQGLCAKRLEEAVEQGRYSPERAQEVTAFVHALGEEYLSAGTCVYAAMTGKPYPGPTPALSHEMGAPSAAALENMKRQITTKLPELEDIINDKNAFTSFFQHLKLSPELMRDKTVMTYIHGGLDLMLGRMPTDDVSYRRQAAPYLDLARANTYQMRSSLHTER